MPERGRQFRNHYGSEARARQRMRFSAAASGVRALQEGAARGEITQAQADQVSRMLISGWAVGRITEMVLAQIDPEKAKTIFEPHEVTPE